jgi:hypothetical protein
VENKKEVQTVDRPTKKYGPYQPRFSSLRRSAKKLEKLNAGLFMKNPEELIKKAESLRESPSRLKFWKNVLKNYDFK